MKKQLNTTAITNELTGASAFFARPAHSPPATPVKSDRPQQATATQPEPSAATPQPRKDSMLAEAVPPRLPEQPTSEPGSSKAITLASYPDSVIETIRKAVKHTGREVTFVRLTPEEKGQLADIVYTYKRQGVKTSENEISRIALAFLLEDYKGNGQESIIAKVIASLLA